MAKFKAAYIITKIFEGGYVNHPSDKGGETYCGIARNYFPNSKIWIYIDKIKKTRKIKWNETFEKLNPLVEQFFKTNFWDKIQGDKLPQIVANQLFDYSVHSQIKRAVKDLQTVCNYFGSKLQIDGIVGPKTIAAVNSHKPESVAKLLLEKRAKFLKRLGVKQPVFASGWNKRVDILKTYITPRTAISFGLVFAVGCGVFF